MISDERIGQVGGGVAYELWDTVSGNLIDEFSSRAEAVAAMRATLQAHGPSALVGLVLASQEPGGVQVVIARDGELAHFAERGAVR